MSETLTMKRHHSIYATDGEARTLAFIFIIAFIWALLVSGCGPSSTTGRSTQASSETGAPPSPGVGDDNASYAACTNTFPGLSEQEERFIEEVCVLTNAEREKDGRGSLVLDIELTMAAQAHAQDMHARNYFSHDNPEGKSPFDRMRDMGIKFGYAAENIAQGYTTPATAMQAWMKSSGHKVNILHAKMKRLGVGYYQGYWVQTFAD